MDQPRAVSRRKTRGESLGSPHYLALRGQDGRATRDGRVVTTAFLKDSARVARHARGHETMAALPAQARERKENAADL